jgi:hypothetical protein
MIPPFIRMQAIDKVAMAKNITAEVIVGPPPWDSNPDTKLTKEIKEEKNEDKNA